MHIHDPKHFKTGDIQFPVENEGTKKKWVNFYKFIDIFFKVSYGLIYLYVILTIIGSFDLKLNEKFKFEVKKAEDINQRLDDVKGIDEIKGEILNIIRMLKNPEKYREKGAKLHKGVMMFGDPGVGKTLLARAIAGEAGVNFIFTSGSNFDEMFVGTGAKRVRELFKEAKKLNNCIIFIDEIDSLLTKSRRFSGEHSSSWGTIN